MIKNRILLLLWTMSFIDIAITAQDLRADVYTPNGSVVVAYITSESSDFVRESYDAEKRLQYPNAIMIDTYYNSTFTKKLSSSSRFNCHGYAWHMSTLSSPLSEPRWIGYFAGNTDEHIYWEDGSYIEVPTAVFPGMVSWSYGDHSAITTSEQEWFISKWRDMPLMKHKIGDSPYGSSGLKFYRSPSTPFISGPSTLCDQATYAIENLPEGATVEWSTSNSSITLDLGQGMDTAVFRQTGFTNGEIQATINSDGAVIAFLTLPVTVCQPTISGPSTVFIQATYTVNNLPDGATVQWSVSNTSMILESMDTQEGMSTAVFRQTGATDGEIRAAISLNGMVIANLTKSFNFYQPTITISGPSLFCDQATYSINEELPQGATVQWNVPSSLEIISGQGTNSVTVSNGYEFSEYVVIGADIFYNGSQIAHVTTPLYHTGPPLFEYDEYDPAYHVFKVYFAGAADYTWTRLSYNCDIFVDSYDHSKATIYSYDNTNEVEFTVTAYNECGEWEQWFSVRPNGDYYYFSLSPNPADSYVTINTETAVKKTLTFGETVQNLSTTSDNKPYTIQLWSSFDMVKQVETEQPNYQLDLTGVPAGFYYVHVIKDGQTYRQQLVVQ